MRPKLVHILLLWVGLAGWATNGEPPQQGEVGLDVSRVRSLAELQAASLFSDSLAKKEALEFLVFPALLMRSAFEPSCADNSEALRLISFDCLMTYSSNLLTGGQVLIIRYFVGCDSYAFRVLECIPGAESCAVGLDFAALQVFSSVQDVQIRNHWTNMILQKPIEARLAFPYLLGDYNVAELRFAEESYAMESAVCALNCSGAFAGEDSLKSIDFGKLAGREPVFVTPTFAATGLLRGIQVRNEAGAIVACTTSDYSSYSSGWRLASQRLELPQTYLRGALPGSGMTVTLGRTNRYTYSEINVPYRVGGRTFTIDYTNSSYKGRTITLPSRIDVCASATGAPLSGFVVRDVELFNDPTANSRRACYQDAALTPMHQDLKARIAELKRSASEPTQEQRRTIKTLRDQLAEREPTAGEKWCTQLQSSRAIAEAELVVGSSSDIQARWIKFQRLLEVSGPDVLLQGGFSFVEAAIRLQRLPEARLITKSWLVTVVRGAPLQLCLESATGHFEQNGTCLWATLCLMHMLEDSESLTDAQRFEVEGLRCRVLAQAAKCVELRDMEPQLAAEIAEFPSGASLAILKQEMLKSRGAALRLFNSLQEPPTKLRRILASVLRIQGPR